MPPRSILRKVVSISRLCMISVRLVAYFPTHIVYLVLSKSGVDDFPKSGDGRGGAGGGAYGGTPAYECSLYMCRSYPLRRF